MKRKPVTLSEDGSRLVEGAIYAGEFTDRSSAVRACLREYFRTHLVETAALLVSREELAVTDVADVLDVDRQRLANLVAAIDEDAAPQEVSSYLAEIEAEFPDVDREDESGDGNATGNTESR